MHVFVNLPLASSHCESNYLFVNQMALLAGV